jgi:hypothetical protein
MKVVQTFEDFPKLEWWGGLAQEKAVDINLIHSVVHTIIGLTKDYRTCARSRSPSTIGSNSLQWSPTIELKWGLKLVEGIDSIEFTS